MKKFLRQLMLFFAILAAIIGIGVALPPTPSEAGSLLFSEIYKDSLLQHVKPPRIIFVGGSNLSLGLNSKIIKDSLGLNPVNTAIHVAIGLIYMMDNTLPYIKAGDIVVVAPEYINFYGEMAYGRDELLRTVLDVNMRQMARLEKKQWINILKYVPKYAMSKFDPKEYFPEANDLYGVNSFNEYGDAYKHWNLRQREFTPDAPFSEQFNYNVLNKLYSFKQQVEAKGGVFYITFPGLQSTSFDVNRKKIRRVEEELEKKGFTLLGSPERYKMPDSMMFNSSYHLTKQGVDYRTRLLIGDIRSHCTGQPVFSAAARGSVTPN